MGNNDVVSNSVGLSDKSSLNQSNSTDNVNNLDKNQNKLVGSDDFVNKNNGEKILNNEYIGVKKDSKSKISHVNANKNANKTNSGSKNDKTNGELKLLTKREAYYLLKNNESKNQSTAVIYKTGRSWGKGENKFYSFGVYDKKLKKYVATIDISAVSGSTSGDVYF